MLESFIKKLRTQNYPLFFKNYHLCKFDKKYFHIILNAELDEKYVSDKKENIAETDFKIQDFINKLLKYKYVTKNTSENMVTVFDNKCYIFRVTVVHIKKKEIIIIEPKDAIDKYLNKISDCIQSAGPNGISLTDLVLKTQYIPKEVRNNILTEKIGMEEIILKTERSYKKIKSIYIWNSENDE
jgi:hypothetical protein